MDARLSPYTQLRDEGAIALHVIALQVVQQPPALAHQEEQAAPRVMVLLVRLQVLREPVDALREDGDLDFGRARVRVVELVVRDQPLFDVLNRISDAMR